MLKPCRVYVLPTKNLHNMIKGFISHIPTDDILLYLMRSSIESASMQSSSDGELFVRTTLIDGHYSPLYLNYQGECMYNYLSDLCPDISGDQIELILTELDIVTSNYYQVVLDNIDHVLSIELTGRDTMVFVNQTIHKYRIDEYHYNNSLLAEEVQKWEGT